ncbi:MAG: preprotein translocase subunit SecG [Eubacteriales bacterium]
MNILIIALYILIAIDAAVLIAVVLMQEGQSGGLAGMVGGDSEYGAFSKRTKTAKLKRYTKISAALLMILCVGLTVVEKLV